MRILSFAIQEADGWTLEPMKLDGLNLLVGLSGAGKTRIVRAIERVFTIAAGEKPLVNVMPGGRFAIDFEHDGSTYRWEVELEGLPHRGSLIGIERIGRGDEVIVDRTSEQFLFLGQAVPRLDRAKSAIAVLKEDPTMAPLYAAFSRRVFEALDVDSAIRLRDKSEFEDQRARCGSLADLGADFSLPLLDKAELLQELFPDAFRQVDQAFRDAFPRVSSVRVLRQFVSPSPDGGRDSSWYLSSLAAEESGIKGYVYFDGMSSGMQRYLSFLIHLSFAPPGTVVLIDEVEASFGINCLPDATRFLRRRAPDLQFILTSHHPYIIEQIPTVCWKIVTRKGSHVRVLDGASIPALEESLSHLDRFTRLINLPEYEQSIQE